TFFTSSLAWGDNTWTFHWEPKHTLGSVASRITLLTGYANPEGWNLNPNDYHSDGRSKYRDYIAAMAAKTTTNRNGVLISPYNHNVASPGIYNQNGFQRDELNACEIDDLYTYLAEPDVGAGGTSTALGLVVPIYAGPWYFDPNNGCDWVAKWGGSS